MTSIESQRQLRETAVPAEAARRFGALGDTVEPVSVGANAIFRFRRSDGPAFLRLTHPELRSRREIETHVAYLTHVFAGGAPVSEPLRSGSGRAVEVVPHGESEWCATAARAVPGRVLGNRSSDPRAYRAWGRALAQLHRAAADFQPAADAELYSVDREWTSICARIPRDDAPVAAEFESVMLWYETLKRSEAIFGITHGDQNAGNALWDGERIRIIDFDEPMANWWAADVARPFNELRDRPPAQLRSWVEAFLGGYREVWALDADLARDLPWFLRLKTLEIYTWLLTAWHDPEAIGGGTRDQHLAVQRACVLNPLRW